MKIFPFTIPKSKSSLLLFQEDKGASFYEWLHQHEELQISFVKQGQGTLIVGNTIHKYLPGSIFVFGSNVPHVFKSDGEYESPSHMLSVFFSSTTLTHYLLELNELQSLSSFFKDAEMGFEVTQHKTEIIRVIEKLKTEKQLNRFLLFFRLLDLLNKAPKESLSSFVPLKKYTDNEGRRMSSVFKYTVKNFNKPITLEEIAQEAAMTKNAFCKYFKKHTKKTYVQFLTELRIEKACQLMRSQKELTMAEVAELSGFQNISNFNRRFKVLKQKTPREFKQEEA